MLLLRRYVRRPSPSMVVALIALLLASGGVAYAAIPNSTTGVIDGCYANRTGALRVIDTQAGETCNLTKETALFWNQQGIAGNPGAPGSDAASALTGRIDVIGAGFAPSRFAYPEGHTATINEQEAGTVFLSPNASIVAQDLSVKLTVAPGFDGFGDPLSRTFTLRDDGADTSVSCTISGSATTCNSGVNTATILPGSELSLKLSGGCGFTRCADATAVMFGWRATTP